MILFFVNIGVLLLLAALCPRPQLGRYRIDAQKLYVVLAMGYLMLLAALRSPVVGTDTLSYCRYFRSAASCDSLHRAWSVLRLEKGYVTFLYLLTRITANEQWLLVVSSVFSFYSFGRFISRYSRMPWMSVLLFYLLMLFDFFLSGMRQMLAIAILLFAYDKLREKKPIPFLLLVLLAVTVHSSAVLFLLLYPICHAKNQRRCLTVVFALAILVAVCWHPLLRVMLLLFPKYSYYSGDEAFSSSGNLAVLSKLAVYALVLLFGVLFGGKQTPEKGDVINFRSVCLLMVVCIVALRANVVSRLFRNIEPILCLYLPNLLAEKEEKEKRAGWILCVICFIAYATVIQLLRTPAWQRTYPYLFFWS